MCVLVFHHRNQSTEIHGIGHMLLLRHKCTAAAQSQLKGAPNIKSIFNPCKVILHKPHPNAFVLTYPSLSHSHWCLWINVWLTSLTDEKRKFFIHYRFWLSSIKNCLISSSGFLKSSTIKKGIRCWVLAGFYRYKLVVMTSVNMLSN